MGTSLANGFESPGNESLDSIERRVLATLRPMYDTQRLTTLNAISAALKAPARINPCDLAAELHALAGTAAHFEQVDLGNLARQAENMIRTHARQDMQLIALRHVRDELERTS